MWQCLYAGALTVKKLSGEMEQSKRAEVAMIPTLDSDAESYDNRKTLPTATTPAPKRNGQKATAVRTQCKRAERRCGRARPGQLPNHPLAGSGSVCSKEEKPGIK